MDYLNCRADWRRAPELPASVRESRLSDGSRVYAVRIETDAGKAFALDMASLEDAEAVAAAVNRAVSVYETY